MDDSRVFSLLADHVALDFINTLDDRFVPELQIDKLQSYADLLSFAEQSKIVTVTEAASLSRAAKNRNTTTVLRASKESRELLARIFYAVAEGERVAGRDLEALNEGLSQAAKHRVLSEHAGEFAWGWEALDKELGAPLWPVLQAAADLLVSADVNFVRACARESCRWLFLDISKNHSRRWCDMKICGNRAKASRYYALHGRE